MHWIQTLDTALFRFINDTLSNPVFDAIMPFASGNKVFFPALLLGFVWLLWKGGARGRLCALMLALIIWPGDTLVINNLKKAIARNRPFAALEEVRHFGRKTAAQSKTPDQSLKSATPAAKTHFTSMPSSHSANWFAGTMILLVYYRRTWLVMLPLACVVALSRIYNGVHYPADVLAGAIIGVGYAVAGMWAANALWQWAGRRWFPLWWEKLPSLILVNQPEAAPLPESKTAAASALDQHWLRLGYIFLIAITLGHLAYIASDTIELSEDEAYQWTWSKHLALSYYSKPPMIAYLQFMGTQLWGDNEFGVRFFSPVIGAILGWLVLRFFAREVNARAGFFTLLMLQAMPMMAVGSILMTIDPPSVLFWTAAMIAGWRAAQPDGKTSHWLWTGLWMGLGFLSKYTQLFQLLSWVVFFALWKPARVHLRRPGPYLALLINLASSLPVLLWNSQNKWITVTHVSERAGSRTAWEPTLRYFFDFVGAETILLNPFFVIPTVWAMVAFWRRDRRDVRMTFLFSMGAPLFLIYFLFTFRSRVLPNWIVPSVIPLLCLAVIYWDKRMSTHSRAIRAWLAAGLVFGFTLVAVLHETNLIAKIAGRPLPPKPDPLTRVRAYKETAMIVGDARAGLIAEAGRPVFIIGSHYGITGQMSFYLPEARTNITEKPLVFYLASGRPENQFYFWPSYHELRKGENAIFVRTIHGPPLTNGWFRKWLRGETNLLRFEIQPETPPRSLVDEFESVTDLGVRHALYRGRIFHSIQLFECRNLK